MAADAQIAEICRRNPEQLLIPVDVTKLAELEEHARSLLRRRLLLRPRR